MTGAPQPAARHDRLSCLFLEACELPLRQREPFLRAHCADDPALLSELMELLHYDKQKAVLDQPVIRLSDSAALADVDAPTSRKLRNIGKYEVLGVLGQGGMGTVYRVRQKHPDRIVALKVIQSGVTSPAMIKRFELEARLLGRLHHPGIAQIYEAGTADTGMGIQPYFAMELVTGRSLLSHAQEHGLASTARLELLAKVCDAVQHAHQRGIVHRDLKSGNIIVDDTSQPKILDFGVARVTDADIKATTLNTSDGQMLGTLPYMSPEQMSGDSDQVDYRSDVYALGVIAYELLTERLPHDLNGKQVLEAVRIIQTDPVTRLSMVDRGFRGDIETIVTKAMEKDRTRRYQSAAQLGADIRRHLQDEPITARPPTAIYQLRKFARRNRALVVGTAVAIGLLVAAVMGTGYGLIVARAQRDEARRAADKAEALRQFFLSILATPAPGVVGRDVKVVDALVAAEADVAAAFPDQPELRADVYAEMAVTFARLGEYEKAGHHARQSLRIRTQTLGETHIDTIKAMNNLGNILLQPSRLAANTVRDEAHAILDRAIALSRQHHEHRPDDLIDLLSNRAKLAFEERQLEDAEQLTRESLDLAMEHLGANSQQAIGARQNLAMLLNRHGKHEEAEEELRQVAELLTQVNGDRHPATLNARRARAAGLVQLKRYDDAEAIYRVCLPVASAVLGENHAEVVRWQNAYAFMLSKIGRRAEAVELYGDALRSAETSLGSASYQTIIIKDSLVMSLIALDRIDEAEPLLRECVDGLSDLHGPEAETTLRESYKLVDVLIRRGKRDEAVTLSTQKLELAEKNHEPDTPAVAISRSAAARALLAAGRPEEARTIIDVCLRDCPSSTPNEHYLMIRAIKQLIESCEQSGFADAAAALRDR